MTLLFDDIGDRLKAFRLGSGLSAEEIAKLPLLVQLFGMFNGTCLSKDVRSIQNVIDI